MRKAQRVLKAATFALLGLTLATALAQAPPAAYPDRPLRLVVPYPPGGATDPVARLLAADAATRLGQPIVVDNKAGATGMIGTEFVVKSAPDGYTLLLHTSVITNYPSLNKRLPFDVKRDLVPVIRLLTGPYLLVINPNLPIRNVADLIAYAKANPGKLSYASSGMGSSGHIIGETFKMAAGIDMLHVPFKGGSLSMNAVMANDVQLVFDTMFGSRALAESGKLRAIAVTGPQRSPAMPDVPTISESGLKDFVVVYWLGIFAPAKTPPEIVDKLTAVFRASLESPSIKSKLLDQGSVIEGQGSAEFATIMDSDIARWKTVIEAAKIETE
jgi:tripartite-type tricarboxylate transporter receptor subunit TctC